MAGHGITTRRPSPNSPLSLTTHDGESKGSSSRKDVYTLRFSCPFNIPSSPESAAVRTVRNLERFISYYVTFVWTVLFIALIPQRKVSVICLVATTDVAFLYFLLLRALPDSVILHKIIDKRFVFFLLFVIASLEMILTYAAVHLFIVLVATGAVVMLHAAVSKGEDLSVHEDGELARLVQETLSEPVPEPEPAQPENLV